MIYNVVLNSNNNAGVAIRQTIRTTSTGLIWKRAYNLTFTFNAVELWSTR
jgi:hypothetical protein